MPHCKVQVVFQGATNVPRDRFINTLHFQPATGANLEGWATLILPALSAFWNTPSTGDNLGKAMPAFISRTVQARFYDMGQAAPRVPALRTFTLGTPISSTALPEEVAVTASFHGAAPVIPSTRGRIYLGPLSSYALGGGSGQRVQVIDAYRTLVKNAMQALAATPDLNWSVFSPKVGMLVNVTGGHVDDAFDTQRRRGMAAVSRTTWGV